MRLTSSKSICIHFRPEKNNECIERSGAECSPKRWVTVTAVNELNEIDFTFSQPNVHITEYILRKEYSLLPDLETRWQYKIYWNLSDCGQESQVLYQLPR